MKNLEYFGTDLRSYGHFYWLIDGDYFERSKRNTQDLPFDPEALPGQLSKDAPQFGDIYFGYHAPFTVLGIYGSAVDHRRGTQSVFFIAEKLEYDDMVQRILLSKLAVDMLMKMPFKIKEDVFEFLK